MIPGPEQTPDVDAQTPDVDTLVAELQAKVKERRRNGTYPPGLEEDLAIHFEVMLNRGMRAPRPVDIHGPLGRIAEALPLESSRIPTVSRHPAGTAFHQTVARIVSRQTEGALQQVQAFAGPVAEALGALTTAFEDLAREVRDDLSTRLDTVLERQAIYERWMTQRGEPIEHTDPAPTPTSDEIRARKQELAARAPEPVLQIGDGAGDVLGTLSGAEDASVGGVVLVQVIEQLSARDIVTLAAVSAAKLAPGGQVLIDMRNPRSVFADPVSRDPDSASAPSGRPLHPAYLSFLFQQAGFDRVQIEWGGGDDQAASVGAARELKRRLFTPRDYLLTAVR